MKIRTLELFAGYGGSSFALKKAGVQFECVGFSEIDEKAIQCYEQNFPGVKNYGDITRIIPEDLPDFDLLTGGFPCVLPDTLITTQRGLLPIIDVVVGDMVLTHKNRWRKVLKTMNQPSNHYYNVKIQGSPLLQITENHPLFCRKMIRVWNSKKRNSERNFSDIEKISTKELRFDDFVGFGNYSDKYCKNEKKLSNEEIWLLGRYVADGTLVNNGRNKFKTIFCVGKSKQKDFIIKTKKFSMYRYEERTIFRNTINNDERIYNLCLACGKGALNKKIPFFIMNLPRNKLQHFFDGYMSGDGCFSNEKYSATSVSKVLIYQLGQIVHRLYETPYNITFCKRPKTTIIENRVVNQNDTWTIRFDKKKNKQDNSVCIDNNIWGRFISKERIDGNIQVYNIEVEEDHSYIANNVIIANCQSFSQAGLRKGFDDARGTLFFDIIRIVKEKKPKYILLENVQGLVNHDGGKTFQVIKEQLRLAGYDIMYKLLNSKDYGIPQNRERIFILGKYGKFEFMEFQFPEKEKLKLTIKDILEKSVDKKYYLTQKQVDTIFSHIERQKAKGNGFGYPPQDVNGISDTIQARNYKEPRTIDVGTLRTFKDGAGFRQMQSGLSPSINARARNDGNGMPIIREENTIYNLAHRQSNGKRYKDDGVSFALETAGNNQFVKVQVLDLMNHTEKESDVVNCLREPHHNSLRIHDTQNYRKLTPRECFRLQGFLQDEININGFSDTALFKMAGNGWDINLVSKIYKRLF